MKKIMTPAEKLEEYQAVNLPDIKRVAQDVLKISQMRLAIIGPYHKESEIRPMLKI